MSKRFYKLSIHDTTNTQCTADEVGVLLYTLDNTLKKTAITLARKAWFDLKDFSMAEKFKITGFSLFLEKQDTEHGDIWHATFTHKNKNLFVIAGLDRNN